MYKGTCVRVCVCVCLCVCQNTSIYTLMDLISLQEGHILLAHPLYMSPEMFARSIELYVQRALFSTFSLYDCSSRAFWGGGGGGAAYKKLVVCMCICHVTFAKMLSKMQKSQPQHNGSASLFTVLNSLYSTIHWQCSVCTECVFCATLVWCMLSG